MNKTQQHEIDRVNALTDEQLWTRYGKMRKEDKIVAFHEALSQLGRVEKLQKEIEEDGYVPSSKNTQPEKSQEKNVEFVRVVKNEDDAKQAIFFLPEKAKFYLYSYVKNEYAHETMVFECDENGDSDMRDLLVGNGYVPSSEMMDRLSEI